ncbi:uncharacterized protein VNE69_04112 [Vairimorpha necatrix]|uniref:Uncharacterized protein n=1 Tax=Vairimorpha necatrix TaxID=6039 RepID=A0AAX4JBP7_9MICR
MLYYTFFVICCEIKNHTNGGDQVMGTSLTNKQDVSKFIRSSSYCNLPFKKRKFNLFAYDTPNSPMIQGEKVDNQLIEYFPICKNYTNKESTLKKNNVKTKNKSAKCNIKVKHSIAEKYTDFKLLTKKLKDQVLIWDLEDEKIMIKRSDTYYFNCSKKLKRFRLGKNMIYRKFWLFNIALNSQFNKIESYISNNFKDVDSDDPLWDSLFFFTYSFEYIKRLLPKNLCYKFDSHKILHIYDVLPKRLEILKNEYFLVKNFRIFRIFVQKKYIQNLALNEVKETTNVFNNFLKKLYFFLRKLDTIKKYSKIVIENLKEIMAENK